MNQYMIITDSGCDLPRSYYAEHGIALLPLAFTIEGVTYYGEGMSDPEFYDKLRHGAMPSTSAANPQDAAAVFRKYAEAGYDVLYIAFSSGLSSTCDAARLAAEQLAEEIPDRKFYVLDSLCASLGHGLLVHKAVKLRDAGASMEEAIAALEGMRLNIVHNFTVDDLNHLHRGGRVSKTTAVVGTLAGIKPILHVDDLGHLVALSKTRGRKASIKALVDRMEKQIVGFDNPEVFISHGDCLEDAKTLEAMVRERFGIEDIRINFIGPVIGTHSGPGTLAVFFLGNPR